MAALAEKDLRESTANTQVLLPMAIIPLVFVVLYPAGLLVALRYPNMVGEFAEMIEQLPPGLMPATTGLDVAGTVAYFATVYLFAPFFLLIPVMVATILAANSFAGEKERHTLEGLLYTPLSDTELVVAKIAGAAIPAIGFAWVCYVIYLAIVISLGTPLVGRAFFPTSNWWVLMVLVVPAASVFVTVITTWVSAKVRGYQEANSMAALAVLPVLALVFGQVSGAMLVGPGVFAIIGIVLVIADVVLAWLVIKSFNREKAVTSYT